MTAESITCSAPGKILLVGGYLVLDPAYTGLVLSLNARIYASIIPRAASDYINVYSPQFKDAIWRYNVSKQGLLSGDERNPFVKQALQTCLTYFNLHEADFDVCIFADDQYYSLPKARSSFTFGRDTIADTPKTGLGSSAALVTSLCAALYIYLSQRNSISSSQTLQESDRKTIHNLAQVGHSKAQGKVGSGFDVASAVFGSCLYSRFPSNIIDTVSVDSGEHSARSAFKDVIDMDWPMRTDTVQLRPGLRLLMGDVSKGSSTPGMVQKVKACRTALDLWPSLGISNELLAEHLTRTQPYDESHAQQESIREVTRSVRGLLKQMGEEAKVDIEPDSQTGKLDKTLAVNGVLACGVPGAGGYDAIYAIIQDSEQKAKEVTELWEANNVKTLDVCNDGQGIKFEPDFDVRHHLQDALVLDTSDKSCALAQYLERARSVDLRH